MRVYWSIEILKVEVLNMKIVTAIGLYFFFVLLGLVAGCGDDKPSGPILGDFAYPLQVGQIWKYSGSHYNFNFRPESIAAYGALSASFVSTVEVGQKTKLLDTLDVYSFHETATEVGISTYQSWNYFNNRSDGFYSYAYGGMFPMMQPRKIVPPQYQLTFHGKSLDDIERLIGTSLLNLSGQAPQADSITTIEDPPFRCLKYPLTMGSEWLAEVIPEEISIKKKVIDRVQIRVPAGIFTCAKVQWLYDLGSDGSWDSNIEVYDYISQIGIVKRTRIYHDVTVTTYEYPLGIGICDYADVWELTQTQSGQ
jgi:hypothetical protein